MDKPIHERRRFERIFFPSDKWISGRFSYQGENGHGEVTAMIMNMSQGGIGISFAREERPGIDKNGHMVIVKIREPALDFMEKTEVELKWILKHESLGYAAGCQFLNLAPEKEQKIQAYLEKIKASMNSQDTTRKS